VQWRQESPQSERLLRSRLYSHILASCAHRQSHISESIYRCNHHFCVHLQIGSERRIGQGISVSKDLSLSSFFVKFLFICAFPLVLMPRFYYNGSDTYLDVDLLHTILNSVMRWLADMPRQKINFRDSMCHNRYSWSKRLQWLLPQSNLPLLQHTLDVFLPFAQYSHQVNNPPPQKKERHLSRRLPIP
jgi:hypothetical protein